MSEQEKWEGELEELFKQKYPSYKGDGFQGIRSSGMPCLSHYYDGAKWGYLKACRVRRMEIERLIKFIPIDSQLNSNTVIHLLKGILNKEEK